MAAIACAFSASARGGTPPWRVLVLEVENPRHLSFDRPGSGRLLQGLVQEALPPRDQVFDATELASSRHVQLEDCESRDPVAIGRCLGASHVLTVKIDRHRVPLDIAKLELAVPADKLVLDVGEFFRRHRSANKAWAFTLTMILFDVDTGLRAGDAATTAACVAPDPFIKEYAYEMIKSVLVSDRLRELARSVALTQLAACAQRRGVAVKDEAGLRKRCAAEWADAVPIFDRMEELDPRNTGFDIWKLYQWMINRVAGGDDTLPPP